ncbi:SagD family bacteriocin biosynthesis docking scaffold [Bacillus toyonensis]|uniref:YcaO-like family protein n=1 Tax=Bacillus toyonensis TaxID=155322 RepID=UPI0002795171|nr:YcaO-like family protein [Bacillus toyonensis]EJQ78349.1 SagD family bacteriocin biosynthesis docking scaffold [Bacillus toyonensis]EJV41879.1 SagD family bacteriocin biosynthesis docking scaffold [Bacillus toyonensis]EJV89942.1 SagD family bacteriocin biosynthesis docking scaffold [Bacillus toyonensis]EOP31998.1 SagD family bacteriocin biosynthesis docking scaffold protein [Bacillus toyonensis]EOP46959.1 SagD family bacteriocin biosynthesis docking scaffold protein [Bacillus toyonensis]
MGIQNALEYIINKNTGIIHHVKDEIEFKLPFPMHMYFTFRNELVDVNEGVKIRGNYSGLGYSYDSADSALISAVGETLERYCSCYLDRETLIKSSFNSLVEKNIPVLDPLSITQPLNEPYEGTNLINKEIDRDTVFNWVQANDEIHKRNIAVPANTIYFDVDEEVLLPHIRDSISTGLATGSTRLQAVENAALECIERDAIVITWLNQLSVPLIDQQTIPDESVQYYLKIANEKGFEVFFFDITTDIKIPTYLVLLRNLYNNYPYIQIGAKAHYDPLTALKGALMETLASLNLLANPNQEIAEIVDIKNTTNIKSIKDHMLYYASGNDKDAFDFLISSSTKPFNNHSEINDFEELKDKLKDMGLNLYSYDLTTEDISSLGLHVYRVLMPELAFLEITIPMLRCNRLVDAPKNMGYTPAKAFNKNPHPFP